MQQSLQPYELAQFTGTTQWYRHPLARNVLWTDGINYLIERAECWWLISDIAIYQSADFIKNNQDLQDFQCWTLKVNLDNKSAVLTCDDGNKNIVYRKDINYTDFPLPEINIFVEPSAGVDDKLVWVILLPSEH